MKRTKYYIDNMVLSFYAGTHGRGPIFGSTQMLFSMARARGRLVGSSLLEEEASEGAPSAVAERKAALRLVQIFTETAAMRKLGAAYAVMFGRAKDDEDLRHYAAASIKRVPYFVSEDGFFKNADNILKLMVYNEKHHLMAPTILSCEHAVRVLSEYVRENPAHGFFVPPLRQRLNKAERALYRRVKAERRARRKRLAAEAR